MDFKVADVFVQVIADKLMKASRKDRTYFCCTHSGLCVPVSLRLVSCTYYVLMRPCCFDVVSDNFAVCHHSNCLLLENIIEMYDFESIHPIN